jgi:MOSC domain-containing protein YiiM
VVSIHIAGAAAAPMAGVCEIRAVPGWGLEGDRYFNQVGTYSAVPEPGRQVTLIEMEAIEAAARETGVAFGPGDSRRNIVTRGVSLNGLLGREFRIGRVRLVGVDLCEPCAHMVQVSGKPVLGSLVHRGGLRADVLGGGIIHVGDPVVELKEPEHPRGPDTFRKPEVEWRAGVKGDQAVLKVLKFESRARLHGRDRIGGFETLATLMLDLDHDGTRFDVDAVFTAQQLREAQWQARFPAARMGANVMAVLSDMYGMQAHLLIPRAQFQL